ncbi:cytochrome b [Vulcaniibacterium gelatinicum]|uniref:cytochrome b n=1 Tax=Vulcaniibacterium gelatinicum TaxID=2598725 RepID=UPI0011CBBFA0|nr:cytochrome b [Vulcaniibacterium gelatinicum]
MHWRNTQDRYGALSIAMHWLMLLLLVAVYATMELRGIYPRGSDPREALKSWHYLLGLGVLALVFVRLAIRLSGPAPRIHPEPALWQRRAAGLMHLALYLFMVAMPLLGWLTLSAEGEQVRLPLLGAPLPGLVGADESLAESAEELHEAIATLGYWLVGLHAAAALFHHYLVRDDTLRRMLPARAARR